jgi:hypothetical protein
MLCKIFYTSIMQVNSYPTVRVFTTIGTGGDDFVQSMVVLNQLLKKEFLKLVFSISLQLCF